MIKIRFGYGKGNISDSFDVSGSVEELQKIRSAILQFLTSANSEFTIEADKSFNPAPYDLVVERMIVKKTDAATKVSFENSKEMLVTGDNKRLEIYAAYFNFVGNTPNKQHTHSEYIEGDDHIAPDSVPLVIMVE